MYQGLSEKYRFASDRHHTFILEAARDLQESYAKLGISFAFHLDRCNARPPRLARLAEQVTSGAFLFESLTPLSDDLVRRAMTKHKGIGNWTADIYLSECLLRCDILPKGDIGVQEAFRVLKGLDVRPTHDELDAMTDHWRPWRSVGTRILWQFYLNQ